MGARDSLITRRGASLVGRNRFGPIRGELEVDVAGGVSTVRQALQADAIDELMLDVVPVLLGAGVRLFDGVAVPGLRPIEVIKTPKATHIRYRVGG